MTPTPDELPALSQGLESKTPQDVLRWSVDTYGPGLTMATAFGAEGCAIIAMLSEIGASVDLFNLDTGYQFPETLDTRKRLMDRYGFPIRLVQAAQSVPEMEAAHGGPLYGTNPDLCCHIRKVVPLADALQGFTAWVSAIRRDQSPVRAHAPIAGWDRKYSMAKINPLANWTKAQVWNYLLTNGVPYNPLHDLGYPSIGCAPCTRAVGADADDRAGRWAGTAKTECGLHVR